MGQGALDSVRGKVATPTGYNPNEAAFLNAPAQDFNTELYLKDRHLGKIHLHQLRKNNCSKERIEITLK